MPSANPAELLLLDLLALLQRIETIDAPVATAYLDTTIEALCRECGLTRDRSVSE